MKKIYNKIKYYIQNKLYILSSLIFFIFKNNLNC